MSTISFYLFHAYFIDKQRFDNKNNFSRKKIIENKHFFVSLSTTYQRIYLKCFITKAKTFWDYEDIDILIETITKTLLKSLFMKTILTIIIITLFSVLHNLIAVMSLYYQFHVP